MSSGETLPPAIMDALLSMIWRLEARLEASEQRLAMANTTPRPEPEFDPILGRPLTSWDFPRPRIAPELCNNHSYSESYGGGGGYSNNYELQVWSYNNYESQAWSYNNYESQAWPYNTYEPYHYNHVPQPVQYEPPMLAQYYSVAELPPQQQHYYPPPPSYTPVSDVDAMLETDVTDSETRVDARTDEIAAAPLLEAIGEEESTPMVDPKLEVPDADAGYEQQLSKLQTAPNVGGDEHPTMDKVGEEKDDFGANDSEVGVMLLNDSNGLLLSPLTSSAGIRKGGVNYLAYEKRAVFDWRVTRRAAGAYYKYGHATLLIMHALLYKAQEADPLGAIPKKGSEGSGRKGLKSREAFRRLVIFGLYALEEVYKDLSNLHLEDKVILKGGGVDTLII